MELLADVGIFMFPDNLVRFPSREWRAAQGFCRFPGLDSTEAERLSGESRLPLLLGTFERCLAKIFEAKDTVQEKADQITNNLNLTAKVFRFYVH
jgi:hypothetical protein